MINRERMVKNFLDLITMDSESGGERRVCDFLKKYLEQFTDDIEEDGAGAIIGGDAGNIIARIAGNTPDRPRILLNAHTDTVKPGRGVKPVVSGDVITSSGDTILGADDKAGIALILETLHALRENNVPHGGIDVIFTVSEEVNLRGARALDPKHLRADYGYTLDCPGGAGDIYTRSPSHDTIVARITGKAAHAGMEPEKGKNAIWIAARAIARMNIGRIDHETTANIGVIAGGKATNIVPDIVEIKGEARSHSPSKLNAQVAHMRDCLEHTAKEYEAGIHIDVEHEYSSYHLSEDQPVIKNAFEAAAALGIAPKIQSSGGGSDANIFNALGLAMAPIGCAMTDCHTTAENININTLVDVARYAVELVRAR